MAIDWSDYLPEILLDVGGCPDRVAENAVRQAAIEFCNEARSWRDQITDVTTAAADPDYTLASPTDSDIVAVHKVKKSAASHPLPTMDKQTYDRRIQLTSNGEPRWYNMDEPSVMRFFPTPDDVYTYEVWAILKPTKDSTSGPNFLYNDWLEVIAHGAKNRLMAMKDRPWSGSDGIIRYHLRKFVHGKTEARIRDAKSNVMSPSMMQSYPFGMYRNGSGRF